MVKYIKDNISSALIVQRLYDQAIVPHNALSKENRLAIDEAYLYHNGKTQKLKLTKQEME